VISGILGDVRTAALVLTACAACLGACSSSGSPGSGGEDASVDARPDNDATMPGVDAGADASDATSPVKDSGGADAADASYDGAADAFVCGWDGGFESPACSACLATSCCDVTLACEDDPSCLALNACVGQCLEDAGDDAGVSACAQDCSAAQPQSVRDEWKAWNDCIGASCGATSRIGPCY
jgi:hypothetical protein